MAANYAFHSHLALNFRLCTFKNAAAFGGLRPTGPLPGLRPWTHGRRNRGYGGTMSPTFGTSGVQRVQGGGPMKMFFASTADSLYSVPYCTSD